MIKITMIGLLAFLSVLSIPAYAEKRSEVQELLLARNQEFKEELIRVSKHVYTFVGVGNGPVSMIVGDDGVVIVDTNTHPAFAKKILVAFRKITDKPIKAIIFTHGHADHTGGARAFLEENTQVWARSNLGAEDRPLKQAGVTITRKRAGRQFGMTLPQDEINHIGIGRHFTYTPEQLALLYREPNMGVSGLVQPTHTFSDARKVIEVAGLTLELVAASGETDDQLYVWYEADRVVFSGDNFYRSWPNLYPIRGSGYRDVYAWINSLSAMLNEKPHHLVAGHTRPVIGEAETLETLTNYRDAIKYVFDKTIEGMNKGLTPDQLVAYAKLPEKYQQLDYLRPYYGHPDWGVRSIFNGLVGWFDGNPTSLLPLPPLHEAEKIEALAGGRKALEQALDNAIDNQEYQWALQLADYLMQLSPDSTSLMLKKADVLNSMAKQVLNSSARYYYRTYAQELRQAAQQ